MRAHERAALDMLTAEWKAEAENWRNRVGEGRETRLLESCVRDLAATLRDLESRPRLLTPAQYARERGGASASTVRRWCQAGALDGATQHRGEWRIPADATPDLSKVRRLTLRAV
jgi:hypothetical protein